MIMLAIMRGESGAEVRTEVLGVISANRYMYDVCYWRELGKVVARVDSC